MWHFHKFFGSPNVHQEICEFWGMGRPPKRHLKQQKNKNNPFNYNRDFARHMSARSLMNLFTGAAIIVVESYGQPNWILYTARVRVGRHTTGSYHHYPYPSLHSTQNKPLKMDTGRRCAVWPVWCATLFTIRVDPKVTDFLHTAPTVWLFGVCVFNQWDRLRDNISSWQQPF